MIQDEMFASIVAAGPGRDDVVYLERCGDSYNWRMVTDAETPSAAAVPDVWMSISAAWPLDEPPRLRAFFNDLLAELGSRGDTADRWRWPADDPWPHHAGHH